MWHSIGEMGRWHLEQWGSALGTMGWVFMVKRAQHMRNALEMGRPWACGKHCSMACQGHAATASTI